MESRHLSQSRQTGHNETRTDRGIAETLAGGVINHVLQFARPYRLKLISLLAVTVLSTCIAVATPVLAGDVVRVISHKGAVPTVISLASVIAALAVFDTAISVLSLYLASRVGAGITYDIRTKVFDHLQKLGFDFFARTPTGALISRINNDVMGAQQAFTSTLPGVVSNTLQVLLTAAVMVMLSWKITLLSLLLVPLVIMSAQAFVGRLRSLMRESYDLNASMTSIATERFDVSGALLVTLYGRTAGEKQLFEAHAGRLRDIGVRRAMYGRVFFVATTLVATLAQAFAYGVGGVLALTGSLDAGSIVAITLLLSRLYGPLAELSNVRIDVINALLSFDRVFEILDRPLTVTEKPNAEPLPAHARTITFNDVHFSYPAADMNSLQPSDAIPTSSQMSNRDVLHGVSFCVEPGQLVAVVGPSGVGKSTIAQLVSRMYDVDSGGVLIGGVDVREARLQSVRDAIGVVSQDPPFFHDTIRANLTYAKSNATEAQLIAAMCAAQVWSLVSGLPEGLDTVVGDHGYRLSGGERQRLAIARVLLKGADIVILDEATSHLDSESEVAVQQALKTALVGRTSLVIAHRLSTVTNADQILVLDGGRIAERGTHSQLVNAGGLYSKLYQRQFRPAG